MGRFTLLTLLVPALAAIAAPIVPSKRAAFEFALQDYDNFQISDGVAGNAEAKANAVFVDPFPADLTTVDATSISNLGKMREAAEDAEVDKFNPQIAAASGDEADALNVGKIQNKVLKLTGEVQQLKIQLAQAQKQGKDTSSIESKLEEEQTKLTKNIATDVKNKGKTSKGVAGTSATAKAARAVGFQLRDYADFQISDGVAGDAQAKANAVFVDPFPADLSTVDQTSLDNLGTMREAAEDAEVSKFNPAIKAATGAEADALNVGKTMNKVLKLTGEVQQIKIKIALAKKQGKDTADLESSLTEEQTKLTKNIGLDVKNKGKKSQGVA